jgi:hypothetical protein
MAGFLDFLLRAKPNAPDLEGKLAELRESRERSTAFLAGLEARRNEMLLDDKPAADIAKLDTEADGARISLEKSEIFESEIVARIASMHGDAAEKECRRCYDIMHHRRWNLPRP